MKITSELADTDILIELGARLARRRLDRGFTQAALAREAGLAKRTVERLEAGQGAEAATLVRVLKALGLAGALEALVPEAASSPMALLKSGGHERRRARARRGPPAPAAPWSWAE